MTNEDSASTFIQQAALEKLKCTKCKKYLSILPIYRSSNGDVICGRCPIENLLEFTQDELYENAIEFQKFPCANRNSGCLEILLPAKLADHEKSCPYIKHECPTKVYNNCTWKGDLSEMLDHFEAKHTTFLLRDCKFEVDLQHNHRENYLMPYGEDLLCVVTREGNSTKRTFSVIVNCLNASNENTYMYNLTLESGHKAYQYSQEEVVGTQLEFQADIVKDMLHDPITIIASISVIEKPKSNSSTCEESSDEEDGLDHEQLKEVECPYCMEYLVPPIYQCEIGHSICKPCKESQSICPTCKGEFKKTQNFVLERIIMNMIYPCKHKGCKHKTKAKNIRQHEASCTFGPFSCPLKDFENCSSIFPISELFNHIKNMHYESLLELDTISIPFNNSVNENILEGYIIKHHQNLFKLCFKYDHQRNSFLWSVQLVGPIEESTKYMFELEIIDSSSKNLRLYLKANCMPLLDMNETFENTDYYVYFCKDQIDKFIKNQLTYRIMITKKL